jgi:hypothetical protein
MKKSALSLILATLALGLIPSGKASAQNSILAEMYGRGVHAYYCGLNDDASRYLSMAIDNGIQDPRAYYFRGLVAYSSGRIAEAEADWQLGAELEASGRTNRAIGRSLARFQGAGRIKLEEIRQRARLNALAIANERSKQRYGELGVPAPGTSPAPAAAAAAPPAGVNPPPVPPDTENPFADDMADGEPNIAANDALDGAMSDPFGGETGAADAAAPAGADPFGGDAGGADPFGGDAGGADPFGGDAGGADPFGGDAGGADPFGDDGSDPFGG